MNPILRLTTKCPPGGRHAGFIDELLLSARECIRMHEGAASELLYILGWKLAHWLVNGPVPEEETKNVFLFDFSALEVLVAHCPQFHCKESTHPGHPGPWLVTGHYRKLTWSMAESPARTNACTQCRQRWPYHTEDLDAAIEFHAINLVLERYRPKLGGT